MTYETFTQVESDFESIVAQLKAEDSDERRWAVYDLGRFSPARVINHLIGAIQDEHRAVREAASEVLGSLPAEACVSKLVPLLGSIRIEVRNIVASVLARFGESAVDDLIPALLYENEDVRKFAADILGMAGSPRAVPGLCKAMEDEVDNVAVSAVEAVGKIGSTEALPVLYRIYDDKAFLQTEAAEAIGLIGDPSSEEFLRGKLHGDDMLVLFSIVDALGNVGTIETLPLLTELIKESPTVMKEQVCQAILRIGQRHNTNVISGNSSLCQTVLSCLKHEDSGFTDALCYQLSLKPDAEVMSLFFRHARDLPPALLVSLIHAAESQGMLVQELCSLAGHEDDWVAYTALESLQTFEKEEVGPTVLSMLRADRGLPALAAMKSAVALGMEEARPALELLLESEDEEIRSAALEVLKTF